MADALRADAGLPRARAIATLVQAALAALDRSGGDGASVEDFRRMIAELADREGVAMYGRVRCRAGGRD
jgi:hypothetical protein